VSVNELFCGNPDHFLRHNIVIQKCPDDPPVDLYEHGVLNVKVVEAPGEFSVANLPGGKVCMMIPAKATRPSLPAYWCPYKQNDIRHATLGNDALYMFTPTMDGCSLGVGSPSGNGVCRVSHVNMGRSATAVSPDKPTPEARAQQRKMQKNYLISEHGHGVQILSPAEYQTWDAGGEIDNAIKTTTWGLHALGKAWEFYTQSYIKSGSKTYLWAGVRRGV
jgi:hypothetical protein